MAMKRFFLSMANGHDVSSLGDLRQYGDRESILRYFNDGTLEKWLDAYDYDELEDVQRIDKKAYNAADRLKEILQLSWADTNDMETQKAEKEAKLRQWTTDQSILSNVDSIAFNDGDLVELLRQGVNKVYLCAREGEIFNIRSKYKNIKYIGILGKAKIETRFKSSLELKENGISVENINLPWNETAEISYSYQSFSSEKQSTKKVNNKLYDCFKKAFLREPGWEVVDDSQKKLDKYDKEIVLKRLGISNKESANILHVLVLSDLSSGLALTNDSIIVMGKMMFRKSNNDEILNEDLNNIFINIPSWMSENTHVTTKINRFNFPTQHLSNDEVISKANIKYNDIAKVSFVKCVIITCKDESKWTLDDSFDDSINNNFIKNELSRILGNQPSMIYEDIYKKLCVFLDRAKDL